MEGKILVTGATGTIGKELVRTLQTKGASFVAAVTNLAKGKSILGPEVDLVEFNYQNTNTYAAATNGVSKVFLLGPPLRNDLDTLVLPFVKHLQEVGIKRVVYVAALKLELAKDLPFHTRVIEALQQGGFNYTVLKPSFFAQNFRNYEWENIMQRNITFVPAGNGKTGFIDVRDLANVAATVLTEEGHEGKTYSLTGPTSLSYTDAAAQLSEVLGKQIIYPAPSAEVYTQVLKDAGAPDFIAPYMISVYNLIADNHVDLVTDDVQRITGKAPTTLKEVLLRDFALEKV